MSAKCKHDCGWYAVAAYKLFVTPEWQAEIGESGRGRRNQIAMLCNAGCGAVRNIYIKRTAVGAVGRVRRAK